MSALQSSQYIPAPQVDRLRSGRQIIRDEAAALQSVADRIGIEFSAAVEMLLECRGRVVVTGIGKAGLIGRKIAATLSSTGTPAHYLHPAEAVHGDLGCLDSRDVVLALSNSGETEEMCKLIPFFTQREIPLIAVTGREESTLATAAAVTLSIGPLNEAGEMQLAPTSSTTAMLAVGDAVALVVSKCRGFTREDFAVVHPGGNLGLRLKNLADVMRRGTDLRIAEETRSVRDVLARQSRPHRRTGAVMLVNEQGELTGLFTDSDLARLLEKRADHQMDRPISEVMTTTPVTIGADAKLMDAVTLLSERRISELPVIDSTGKPVGLIDITDMIALMPDIRTASL